MDLRLQIQVNAFNGAMRDMAARLGDAKTQQRVIDYEVARIMEKALQGTKAATVAGIRKNHAEKQWTTFNQKHYKLSWRFPNPLWKDISEMRKRVLQKKLAARGLSKRTWSELGISFGQHVKAPEYVYNAVSHGHTGARNVGSIRQPSTKGYGLVITNSSPLLQFSDARRAFFSAVAGRRLFYERNVAMGVFNDLKQVAKKYPGMLVTP